VAADCQSSAGNGPAAKLSGPGFDVVDCKARFKFPPQFDALQQGAAVVHPWLTITQGGIQVKVAVHKWRADQPARGIDLTVGLHFKPGADVDNATLVGGNVDAGATIGKVGFFYN
jgi:hypothetical protein